MAAASTPNAAPVGCSSLPAPARPSPRRVPGRRPLLFVMRDQSSRIQRQRVRAHSGRDLRLIGYGALLTLVFVVLPILLA